MNASGGGLGLCGAGAGTAACPYKPYSSIDPLKMSTCY